MRRGESRRDLLRKSVERPGRGEEDPQADIDEVDPCDGERDVAGQDDALVQHAVDELDERHLLRKKRSLDNGHAAAPSSSAKLYGGHGPVTSNATPIPAVSAARRFTSSISPASSFPTRY